MSGINLLSKYLKDNFDIDITFLKKTEYQYQNSTKIPPPCYIIIPNIDLYFFAYSQSKFGPYCGKVINFIFNYNYYAKAYSFAIEFNNQNNKLYYNSNNFWINYKLRKLTSPNIFFYKEKEKMMKKIKSFYLLK